MEVLSLPKAKAIRKRNNFFIEIIIGGMILLLISLVGMAYLNSEPPINPQDHLLVCFNDQTCYYMEGIDNITFKDKMGCIATKSIGNNTIETNCTWINTRL